MKMTLPSTSLKLRRPTALIVLSILASALLSLHAIGWAGNVRLAQSIHFRWPSSNPASLFLTPVDPSPQQTLVLVPPPVVKPKPTGPPISIIVIWKNGGQPYMPNFIESVLANAASLEVLWVGVKWAHETECFDPMAGHPRREGANFKLLCLTEDEYWQMHRDYFCERWGCNAVEKKDVLDAMIERQQKDYQHSFLRLWRGYVFREHINPDARWWGWADPDTFLGNFDTQFPWDASNFDVFIPASPHTLLYLRGHLCFFRTGSKVENKLGGYPNLQSPQAYLERHKVGEYTASASLIIRSPHISFLLASSSLVDIPLSSLALNTPTFATLNGTYAPYTLPSPLPPIPHLPVLGLPGTCPSCPPPAPRRRTFTDYGLTRPVELRWGQYEGDVWFAREHATSYDPPMRSLRQRGWDVYVGRYEGGGAGVWERIEPPRAPVEVPVLLPPAREEKGEEDEHHATAQQNVHSEPQGKGKGEDKVKSNAKKSKPARKTEPRSASVQPTSATAPPATYLLREGLYIHWFHQKHAAWFPGPAITPVQDRGMGVGRTLMSVFKEGAEVWEGGEVVWRSG